MSEKDEGESKGEGRVESGEWRAVQGSRLRIAMVFVFVMNSDQTLVGCCLSGRTGQTHGPLQGLCFESYNNECSMGRGRRRKAQSTACEGFCSFFHHQARGPSMQSCLGILDPVRISASSSALPFTGTPGSISNGATTVRQPQDHP